MPAIEALMRDSDDTYALCRTSSGPCLSIIRSQVALALGWACTSLTSLSGSGMGDVLLRTALVTTCSSRSTTSC